MPVDSEHPLILIVEDDQTIRHLCARLLNRAGFTTLTAATGAEALKQFEAHAPLLRVVMLDLHLGREDGAWVMDACHAIKPQVPFVVMSGTSEQQMRESFPQSHQPTAYLAKPFSPPLMLQLIARLAQHKEM
ncbi:MAG: response regulator [Myxococcota bacterium]